MSSPCVWAASAAGGTGWPQSGRDPARTNSIPVSFTATSAKFSLCTKFSLTSSHASDDNGNMWAFSQGVGSGEEAGLLQITWSAMTATATVMYTFPDTYIVPTAIGPALSDTGAYIFVELLKTGSGCDFCIAPTDKTLSFQCVQCIGGISVREFVVTSDAVFRVTSSTLHMITYNAGTITSSVSTTVGPLQQALANAVVVGTDLFMFEDCCGSDSSTVQLNKYSFNTLPSQASIKKTASSGPLSNAYTTNNWLIADARASNQALYANSFEGADGQFFAFGGSTSINDNPQTWACQDNHLGNIPHNMAGSLWFDDNPTSGAATMLYVYYDTNTGMGTLGMSGKVIGQGCDLDNSVSLPLAFDTVYAGPITFHDASFAILVGNKSLSTPPVLALLTPQTDTKGKMTTPTITTISATPDIEKHLKSDVRLTAHGFGDSVSILAAVGPDIFEWSTKTHNCMNTQPKVTPAGVKVVSPSPVVSPTMTPTPSPSKSVSPTPTSTPSKSPTPTPTHAASPTPSVTPTSTASPSPSNVPHSPAPSNTPTPSPSSSSSPSSSPGPPSHSKPALSTPAIIGVAAGGGGGVLIAIVVIALCCFRRKAKSQHTHEAQEGLLANEGTTGSVDPNHVSVNSEGNTVVTTGSNASASGASSGGGGGSGSGGRTGTVASTTGHYPSAGSDLFTALSAPDASAMESSPGGRSSSPSTSRRQGMAALAIPRSDPDPGSTSIQSTKRPKTDKTNTTTTTTTTTTTATATTAGGGTGGVEKKGIHSNRSATPKPYLVHDDNQTGSASASVTEPTVQDESVYLKAPYDSDGMSSTPADLSVGIAESLNKEGVPMEQCDYYQACKGFVEQLKLGRHFFEPNHHICYCPDCYDGPAAVTRGDPPKAAAIPVGWVRFSLNVDEVIAFDNQIWQQYHVHYHGTKIQNLKSILKHRRLMKPGLVTTENVRIEVRKGHLGDGDTVLVTDVDGTQKLSSRSRHPDDCDCGCEPFQPSRYYFTSPSVVYASRAVYGTPARFHGRRFGAILQVRQRPNSYGVLQETVGATAKGTKVDPLFDNKELEVYTEQEHPSIVVTGLLIKILEPKDTGKQ